MSLPSIVRAVRDELKAARDEADISQKQIAYRLLVTESRVSQMFSGENLTLTSLARLADVMQCRVEIRILPKARGTRRYPVAWGLLTRDAAEAERQRLEDVATMLATEGWGDGEPQPRYSIELVPDSTWRIVQVDP